MEQITKRFMSWASILEDATREQVQMTSEMPFIYPHIALMPDAHLGKGCAVGAVLPTVGAIMPAAVGVDIGCGMIAVQTNINRAQLPIDRQDLRSLRLAIEASIPLSAGNANLYLSETAEERVLRLASRAEKAEVNPGRFLEDWQLQLGTLGSGNHFIEVSLDENDDVWLFLHSGSRGVGNKIAQHFIRVAQAQCAKRFISLPHPDLAYLVEGDREFWDYMSHLRWAQEYAFANREEMMDRVFARFTEWMGDTPVVEVSRINCHHNYTTKERHFGKDVWLSRKGAIDASAGTPGLIPGSMGTRSYVVEGKGNYLSLNSSPHGAGREYGRKQAERTFTVEELNHSMEGIEWSGSDAFLDEIPTAYKSIDVVMDDAKDLVEIKHTLRQIINVKGT